MKTIILIFSALFLLSCSNQEPVQTQSVKAVETSLDKRIKNCICTKIYMPVCGEDNKTYGNACEAECAGVKYTMGKCENKK